MIAGMLMLCVFTVDDMGMGVDKGMDEGMAWAKGRGCCCKLCGMSMGRGGHGHGQGHGNGKGAFDSHVRRCRPLHTFLKAHFLVCRSEWTRPKEEGDERSNE